MASIMVAFRGRLVGVAMMALCAVTLGTILVAPARATAVLSSGYVTPTSGDPTTGFTWRAKYWNTGNVAPTSVQVGIWSAATKTTSWRTMWALEAGDTNYVDGKWYTYSSTLAAGGYAYRFAAQAGGSWVYWPEPAGSYASGPTVTSPVTLSSAYVTPPSGDTITSFTWRLKYWHTANVAPTAVWVAIRNTVGGAVSWRQMQALSPDDTNYVDGKWYTYSSALAVGAYGYRFAAQVGALWTYWPEPSGSYAGGPTVTPPPYLLSSGYLTPTAGDTTMAFTWRVKYWHTGNVAPTAVWVAIRNTVGGAVSWRQMQALSPDDTNYVDGKWYTYSSALAVGAYGYRFAAQVGALWTYWPEPSGSYVAGPTVTVPPYLLSSGYVTPPSGDTTTNFTWRVKYWHSGNVPPTAVSVAIRNTAGGAVSWRQMQALSPDDTNYVDGKWYTYSSALAVGAYGYRFAAQVGALWTYWPDPAGSYASGPTVADFCDQETEYGWQDVCAANVAADAGDAATAKADYQAALTHFEAALGACPNHDGANAGWIVAEGGYVAMDLKIKYAAWSGSPAPPLGTPLAETLRDALATCAQTMDVLSLPRTLQRPEALELPLMGALRQVQQAKRMAEAPWAAAPPFPYAQAITDLQNEVLPALQQMLSHLQKLETADLALEITDCSNPLQYVILDYGDVLLLDGMFRGAIGMLNQLLAYNLNPGTFYDTPKDLYQYDTSPADGKVTPSEYMAPAPFGTLVSSSRMSTALTEYRTAADRIVQGVNVTLLEVTDDHELLPVNTDLQLRADVQQAGTVAGVLKQALAGLYVLRAADYDLCTDVTLNLPHVFTSPSANLRSVLPTFTVISPSISSVEPPSGWPDRTFGGLFTSALPDCILYPVGSVNVGVFNIPVGTASTKVIGRAEGGVLGPRDQVQEKSIPSGQSMATFTNVPAGWLWLDAWCVNSAGVPIAQGWGDGEVVQGQTSAAMVEMYDLWWGSISWFHGRVKWNGRATITYPWVEGLSLGGWLGAWNGEFYIGVQDMVSSQIAWLDCSGFQIKQISLPLTAAGTVRELGDIAVVPETPAPPPLTRERVRELRRAAEQQRQKP